MNIVTPFADTYTEVTIPLNDKTLERLENSQYSYLLNDYYSADNNAAYIGAYCTITVIFDFAESEVYFHFNTVYVCEDVPPDQSSTLNVLFDPETAEYFKTAAMRSLLNNFNAMNKCRYISENITMNA